MPESNRRPSACKADALPTELIPRLWFYVFICTVAIFILSAIILFSQHITIIIFILTIFHQINTITLIIINHFIINYISSFIQLKPMIDTYHTKQQICFNKHSHYLLYSMSHLHFGYMFYKI